MNLKRLLVYLSCFVCLATFCIGQTAVLMPQPKIQFLNQNGLPLAGGCVNTYAAGTTTNQSTFKDGTGSAVNANPVVLDSAGRASIFLTKGVLYKFVVTSFGGSNCSTGTLQYTQDNVALGSNLTIGGTNGQVQYNSNGFAGSPNFTWNNATQTLSVGALVTTSGGTLAGSFGGSPIWTGAHTFNSTVSFPGGIINPVTHTNAGLFDNSQYNQYWKAIVGGCNNQTLYTSLNGGNENAAINACIKVPLGATQRQNDAIAGMVDQLSGTGSPAVGVFGGALGDSLNGRSWGANFVYIDNGFATPNGYAAEFDYDNASTTSVPNGILVTGLWTAQSTAGQAIGVAQNNTAFHWPIGLRFYPGATNTLDNTNAAIEFDATATANNSPSQGINFFAVPSGGGAIGASIKLLPTGVLQIDNPGNTHTVTGITLNGNTLTQTAATGTATVDLASVASGACTADSADVTLTGAVVGDPVRVTAAVALTAGNWLIGRVTAANTGRFQLCNLSGGAVDRASDTYTISVVK